MKAPSGKPVRCAIYTRVSTDHGLDQEFNSLDAPAKPTSRKRSAPASPKSATPPRTKHAHIVAMLRAPAGATIVAMMAATEWQQHSVRGFLAGVVRKKLGLNLVSEQTDKGRVYRIKDGKGSSAAAVKQAA